MRNALTAADVLNDIEFELMQGSVGRDELGRGIQTTRQYQNEVRAQMSQIVADQKVDAAELVGRQFQINDMVLSLFQAVEGKLKALQLELRRAAYLKQHSVVQRGESDRATAEVALSSSVGVYPPHAAWLPDYVGLGETTDDDLADAMADDALEIPLDVRPARVPLVGWFLTRLRASLHVLTLFYVEQLARKQTPINQTYGERILHLEQIVRQQHRQIEALTDQLGELRKRLDG